MSDATPPPAPMKVRCPVDDGSARHLAFDVRQPVMISKAFSRLAKTRCHCGARMVIDFAAKGVA